MSGRLPATEMKNRRAGLSYTAGACDTSQNYRLFEGTFKMTATVRLDPTRLEQAVDRMLEPLRNEVTR